MFSPIPDPSVHDWLANHREDGQTFVDFVHFRRQNLNENCQVIYILPLNFFGKEVASSVLGSLVDFASIFFNLSIKLLPVKTFSNEITSRRNGNILQVNATNILSNVRKLKPADGFCLAAITMCDLYPEESWNFVFGLANVALGVGVYSLARYLPGFFDNVEPKTDQLSR